MEKWMRFVIISLAFSLSGCSTAAYFKLPPNSEILIKGQRARVVPGDEYTYPRIKTRPFFWNSMSGINYSLLRGDKIVSKGKLPSRFRPASIFWPPYALLYWPVGFGHNCFDLRKDHVEECYLDPEGMEKRDAKQASQDLLF